MGILLIINFVAITVVGIVEATKEETPKPAPITRHMEKGELFCPFHVPHPSTNAESNQLSAKILECQNQGLCLAQDGKSCKEKTAFGVGQIPQ